MTQPRNRATAEAKRRRQRLFNRIILVATLVIIITVSAYALSRPNTITLPAYLNRCVPLTGNHVYNSTFSLNILINGANYTIPAAIGILGRNCIRPIFTLSSSGAVHIATDQNVVYTLKDFFLIWGNTYGPTWSTFNSEQLFSYRADATHPIVLTVGNNTDPSFENYPLPTSGSSSTNPPVTISYG